MINATVAPRDFFFIPLLLYPTYGPTALHGGPAAACKGIRNSAAYREITPSRLGGGKGFVEIARTLQSGRAWIFSYNCSHFPRLLAQLQTGPQSQLCTFRGQLFQFQPEAFPSTGKSHVCCWFVLSRPPSLAAGESIALRETSIPFVARYHLNYCGYLSYEVNIFPSKGWRFIPARSCQSKKERIVHWQSDTERSGYRLAIGCAAHGTRGKLFDGYKFIASIRAKRRAVGDA